VLTYLPAQITVLATAQITLPARSSEADGRNSMVRCIDTGGGLPTVTLVPAGADVLLTGDPNQTFNQKTTVLASAADVGLEIPAGWSAVSEIDMLGLGDSALLDIGTAADTVAAGDDSRFTTAATTGADGLMSSADKTKLDGVESGATANAGTITDVSGTAPISSSGGATPAISISAATVSEAGSMSAADKTILDTLGTGYKVLSKTTFSSATASVDINPTGYSNIKIILHGRGDSAATSVGVRMRINGSSASEYLINSSASTTSFNSNGSLPGSLTNTNRQGYWECDFSVGGVGEYTAGVQRGVHMLSTATAGLAVTQNALIFTNDSAAITSILVYPSADNFAIGSKITVLGLA
jgi:hypothetical protein